LQLQTNNQLNKPKQIMKQFLLTLTVLGWGFAGFSQSVLTGTVIDADTRETIIGATVYDANAKIGTVTNLEGRFRLNGVSGTELTVSFMGYQTEMVTMTSEREVFILLKPITLTIKGAEVIANVAVARKTPVAVSSISPLAIQEKLGTQEFPEILKSTPGVYATKMGGGFGDARITLRGFASENIAVMINGVPMNDMEHGGVYWSNWAGLADVTRSMQVQRGLGASKVAAPSVGGSINIVTKSTDALKGGSISYGIGNDGYNKISFSASTGLAENGWAVSILGAKTWGDGYILGTKFESYSYFANISKQFNKNHIVSFTGFGAPQWHHMRRRFDRLLISEWDKQKEGFRFNPSYGVDMDGRQVQQDYNFYHKPQLSLNHYWTISEKSSLSTALYSSIGRGGGHNERGNERFDLYGARNGMVNTKYRTPNGYFDYTAVMRNNAGNPNGSQIVLGEIRNHHDWYGLLSTFTSKLNDHIDYHIGLDLRYYEGLHDTRVVDLLGGTFFIDPDRAARNYRSAERNTFEYVNQKLKVGDIIGRDNTGYVVQEGVFGQVEYNKDKFSAFVSTAVSNHTYWKIDRFYYDDQKSDVKHFWGYVAKTGINYNLTDNHNLFANIGHISRAPFMNGSVFLSIDASNATNPDPKNEKIFSKEIGYGFRSQHFIANLNLYHTNWNDKAMIRAVDATNPDRGVVNLQGVNALHKGIELDFVAKPTHKFEIRGMLSVGDWKWNSNASGYAYNRDGQAVASNGDVVEPLSTNHMKLVINGKGLRVGNAAQITANLGMSYNFLTDIRAGFDYTYYDKHYADFNIISINEKPAQPWRIPRSGQLDFFARYNFTVGKQSASLTGNITNILNSNFIMDATNGSSNDWRTASVFYSFGRTMSVTLKVNF
jgi:hypothetical protein